MCLYFLNANVFFSPFICPFEDVAFPFVSSTAPIRRSEAVPVSVSTLVAVAESIAKL